MGCGHKIVVYQRKMSKYGAGLRLKAADRPEEQGVCGRDRTGLVS